MRRRIASAVVFIALMLAATPAVAQETIVELLTIPQAFRDPETPLVLTTPQPMDANLVGTIRIQYNIPTSDYENVANGFTTKFFVEIGGQWLRMATTVWPGGRYVDEDGIVNPAPTTTIQAYEVAGRRVRTETTVARRMRLGASVQHVIPQ